MSKGVAILIKANLYLNINRVNLNLDGRIIALTINFDSLYALNNGVEGKRFMREVHSFIETLEAPCVIGADFNCALYTLLDRKRASMTTGHVDEGSRELNDLMSLKDKEDVWRRRHPNNKKYTFERGESKSRIDFYLVSKEIDSEIDKHVDCNLCILRSQSDNVYTKHGQR